MVRILSAWKNNLHQLSWKNNQRSKWVRFKSKNKTHWIIYPKEINLSQILWSHKLPDVVVNLKEKVNIKQRVNAPSKWNRRWMMNNHKGQKWKLANRWIRTYWKGKVIPCLKTVFSQKLKKNLRVVDFSTQKLSRVEWSVSNVKNSKRSKKKLRKRK